MTEEITNFKIFSKDSTYEVFRVAEAWRLWDDAELFNVLKYIEKAGRDTKVPPVDNLKKAMAFLKRKIGMLEHARL